MVRPAKPDEEKFRTPARQLGRVSDEDWETLQRAAEKSGKTFIGWSLPALLAKAKRELRKSD